MEQVLEVILEVKEKFKSDHVANVLSGNADSAIKAYKHHKLEVFGSGSEKDPKFWNSVIRQGLVAHFIQKDIENYGLLRLTPEGHEFLKNPYPILLCEDHTYSDDEDEDAIIQGGKTSAVDEELFNILKDLRKKMAKTKNLPPFVIFQDNSLEDMAIQYPINNEELQNIVGVGAGKAVRYGKEFLDVIKSYVEEKEIIRPQDMVVKSVVNKSGLKVYIIQAIDRKMMLDDICEAKDLDMNSLLNEIEAIVNSGTKLNLDYYIDEILDEEHQDEIYDYFREDAQSESLDEAIHELGDDNFSEEEIRLMRIKFISEMGN
jgi:ATP-dependent DNA helicase RecQ